MTTKTAVITAGVLVVVTTGALVINNTRATTPTTQALTAGTPAPPDICTGNYAYKDVCGSWRLAWPGQGPPGSFQSVCEHARMYHEPTDGKYYHVVGQGQGGTRWARPPASATEAVAFWDDCFIQHNTSGNYPSCLLPPIGGTQTLTSVPISSPLIPAGQRAAWLNQFSCSSQPSPTATAIPITPVPGTPTPAPTAHVICIPVTVTPKVAEWKTIEPSPEMVARWNGKKIHYNRCTDGIHVGSPCPTPKAAALKQTERAYDPGWVGIQLDADLKRWNLNGSHDYVMEGSVMPREDGYYVCRFGFSERPWPTIVSTGGIVARLPQ